jgi:hypothetical protein
MPKHPQSTRRSARGFVLVASLVAVFGTAAVVAWLHGAFVFASVLPAVAAFPATPSPPEAPLALGEAPIVLVPGWGPGWAESFETYASFLVADGVPRERIHIARYPFIAPVGALSDALDAELRAIFARYPTGTRFDFITHSLGQFAALHALVTRGLEDRVRLFVGLAGIAHGWSCDVCAIGVCGAANRELTPFQSAFVQNFHARYGARIRGMRTCSLFSPADELVRPYDAGALAGGTNVAVPDMGHMQAITKREFYEVMRRRCYGR